MFRYLNRNLISLFTKQRLLSLLLVINIVVSCLVICFSCGLYHIYQPQVEEAEEEGNIKSIHVYIESDNWVYTEDQQLQACTTDITPQMFMDLLGSFSDEINDNIEYINADFWIETPFSYFLGIDLPIVDEAEIAQRDDIYYSEDADPFYWPIKVFFKMKDGKIVDAAGESFFTYDQYNSGEKIIAVSEGIYWDFERDHQPYIKDYLYLNGTMDGFSDLSMMNRIVPKDTDSLLFGGERYKIIKEIDELELRNGDGVIEMPLTAIPDGALVSCKKSEVKNRKACFTIFFNKSCTHEQYEEIQKCITNIMGDNIYLQKITFTDAKEVDFFNTVIIIAIIISVLAAVNMAILYRYILEKRSGDLAILRICGCTKNRAIASYLTECMIINAPLFALTQLCYHKLIMPKLAKIFPDLSGAYSGSFYIGMFCIYIAVSAFIMYRMIVSTVRRHSLVELKSASKATSRFGLMKVFEILQLAVVLSLMVFIVSAIVSRYSMFKPFEQYLSRKGYMLTATDFFTQPEDIEEIIGDAEYIRTEITNTYDGDATLNAITYSDEFIEAYKPPLQDGIWLDEVDFTYKDSGYIPAVITYCDGRYKVGDVIESDMVMNFDENEIITARYKIIGVLRDKVSIASYVLNNHNPESYLDIYSVFSDEFEEHDWLLIKISDSYDCYGNYGPAYGTQFIFCDDMTDEEYEKVGLRISNGWRSSYPVPLSTIYKNSKDRIYEQMYTLFPIAVCIFILTIISTVSISAIYTKRQLRNYAIFYICGARWRTCALKSLKNGAITCAVAAVLSALILVIGKATLLKETVISFGLWHFAVCAGVIVLYLILSMIMPLSIIGSAEPREVLKEE